MDPNHWHGLRDAVWSEVPAVKVMAMRVLRDLQANDVAWVSEVVETVFLEEEIEEWLEKAGAL